MTDGTVTHLPEPGVVLDLDLEERNPKDVKPPFIVKLGGKNIQFADPGELDWRDLASVEIPGDLLHVALSKEDLDHVRGLTIEAWKFNRLLEAYYTHYDLEDKIREAQRRQKLGGV